MNTTAPDLRKDLYYPPGGILIWIILFVEIVSFLLATTALMYYRSLDVEMFTAFQNTLDVRMGTLNTIVLITSGYLIANAVDSLKKNLHEQATKYITLSTVLGVLFLVFKSIEYYHKVELGLTLSTNIFYTFYWMVTGFHFIHVIIGIIILLFMRYHIKQKNYNAEDMFDVESSATYWHMCDLIWILIFPVFYLIN